MEDENTEEAKSRIENLSEFLNVVIEFERENADNSLQAFLENLALVTDLDNVDEKQDNVLLMTLHTAKGLEFPVVFMVGMEDGLFPSSRSIGEEAELEEERRLCYVGITRAKQFLYMTGAKCRMMYGSTTYCIPSRFLSEIPSNLYDGSIHPVEEDNNSYERYYDKYSDNYSDNVFSYGKAKGYLSKEYSDANSLFGRRGYIDTPTSAFGEEPLYESASSVNKSSNTFNFKSAESFLKGFSQTKPVDISEYEVGQKVEHKKFGIGTITKIEPEDDDLKVEIEFERSGMKRLMAKYAGIKIIDK